ncbi:MAG TPA: GNAT family protein [Vicinamibacterales bacterium]
MNDPTPMVGSWRDSLPVLAGAQVLLREPDHADVAAVLSVLSLPDATRFGVDEPVTAYGVQQFIEAAPLERAAGRAFTYIVTLATSQNVVGLLQVRQLDPAFEAAEWECTLDPSVRGTGVFLEVARLAGSLAFGTVGAHRLEARALLQSGRANGALRKLGAVQEGILRRSARRHDEYLDQVLWSVLRDDWGQHWVSAASRVH